MFWYITSWPTEFEQHKFHNEIRKSQSLELWESCQWQPAMVSKHNIIFYMLRLFYKVVWLWGHGHHARRASKITFVQRPNTSAVCTHGTQAAMLKKFSWKISHGNSLTCQQIDSEKIFDKSLPHCHSLQVSYTYRLPCILSAIFSLGSFTPKETLKRSSASWPCLTPFTTLLNDRRWGMEQEEGVKQPSSCQPQDRVAGGCWTTTLVERQSTGTSWRRKVHLRLL